MEKNKNLFATSLKKVFINYPFIKHTNNTILLLIYIFNKNKLYMKNKLNKLNRYINLNNNIIQIKNKINIIKFNEIKYNSYLKEEPLNVRINNIRFFYNILNDIVKEKSVKLIFKRYFLANIYLNNFKLNNLNLINLKKLIYRLYNKNINLNITNLKYVYLNNSIFIMSVINKLNDRKKSVLRVLKKALKLVKMARLDSVLLLKKEKFKNNNKSINGDYINSINIMSINKYKNIFKSIKNIHIIGISMEAKGRLTRR